MFKFLHFVLTVNKIASVNLWGKQVRYDCGMFLGGGHRWPVGPYKQTLRNYGGRV